MKTIGIGYRISAKPVPMQGPKSFVPKIQSGSTRGKGTGIFATKNNTLPTIMPGGKQIQIKHAPFGIGAKREDWARTVISPLTSGGLCENITLQMGGVPVAGEQPHYMLTM